MPRLQGQLLRRRRGDPGDGRADGGRAERRAVPDAARRGRRGQCQRDPVRARQPRPQATPVVWAATRYGLHVSDEQALQVAGGAFIVLAPFVRQLVTPTVKQPQLEPLLAVEPSPTIQVHVAGADPARVADEVAKAVRRHPAAGTVDTGALTRHPVTAEPPPPPDPGKPSS